MDKQDVKEWLKAIKKDRQWLAEMTGATLSTVNKWLSSSRGVPANVSRLIERLMTQYPVSTTTATLPPSDDENTLTLTVDAPTFDSWNAAAMEEGKLLRQWAIDVLNEKV